LHAAWSRKKGGKGGCEEQGVGILKHKEMLFETNLRAITSVLMLCICHSYGYGRRITHHQ
jgi:hypothetical protein